MRTARWVVFGVVVGGSVLATILYFGLSSTRELTISAERFLTQVGAGAYRNAYEEMSGGFRNHVGQTDFERRVKDDGLDGFVSVAWSSRRIKNGWARAYGTVSTRGGGSVPMRFDFVYDGQVWRISDFFVSGRPVPSDREDEGPGPPSPAASSPSSSSVGASPSSSAVASPSSSAAASPSSSAAASPSSSAAALPSSSAGAASPAASSGVPSSAASSSARPTSP